MHEQKHWSICPFGLGHKSHSELSKVVERLRRISEKLVVRVPRRYELTICVLMLSQITILIQIPASPSTSFVQHVRIHTKLLRLLELHRPSHALHQNVDGRECEEEMLQSTSRTFHCGLGYLQHMSVAGSVVTPFEEARDTGYSGSARSSTPTSRVTITRNQHRQCRRRRGPYSRRFPQFPHPPTT